MDELLTACNWQVKGTAAVMCHCTLICTDKASKMFLRVSHICNIRNICAIYKYPPPPSTDCYF